MLTLSYGYLKPQSTDTGDVVFPALELDIQKLNDHTHNGTDSAPLASQSLSAPAASWVAAPIGGGVWRQAVNFPTGYTYTQTQLWFKLTTGEYVYPSVEKITENSFYVYTNDNTLTYSVFFR